MAGLGIIGWALLIFLPTWRPTRALAGSAFFPIYIAILYAFGVGALFMEYGFGFVADFGTAEGVTRLLARPEIAIVAWIHILAFDQAIGLAIYRENMRRHYVPIPVQSVILFLTLMFGPLGYLAFVLARVGRLGTQAFGGSARTYDDAGPAPRTNSDADPGPRTSADAGPALRTIFAAYRENWSVTLVALAGVALGILSLLPIAVRGSAIVPPEGDLMKPATFDLAVGIFILSLIPWLPAAFGEPGIRNALLHRGARHHGALDRARRTRVRDAGGRPPRAAGHRRALGRAGASILIGFLAGFYLSANQGRFVGETGNLLPLHAAGFHAVQAIPLVALLFAWSAAPVETGKRWLHVAGAAWALACVAIWWRTANGRAVTDLTGAGTLSVVFLGVWTIAALRALVAWRVHGSMMQARRGTCPTY
ncbi:MAG: hypothetical protein A3F70_16685 [Acidobacteria bacterium RIFCSPLOWO2_12_FULL_67_14]|nr:MAG: hypothetical protein A3F70_16685 [Acidobacteria bacterium RIFCSPLOWO2_12_FULL_67_14]